MTASGQERRIGAARNISALPPRADVGADIVVPPVSAIAGREQSQQIRFLFDHLVGEREHLVWNLEAERLRGLEIDDELELGRL
jgi:hypothetical protein